MNQTCPLSTHQILEEYFLENRNRLLDIAAFLDRLDRSADGASPDTDFRARAFRSAIEVLSGPESNRAKRVHMILSDPTTEPRERLDRKAAYGAYNPDLEVRS